MPPPGKSKNKGKATRSKKGENPSPQEQRSLQTINAVVPQPYSLPIELQQIILNTFNIAFPMTQDSEGLKQVIQEVKGHLFNRNFASAFGQPSYLQAYALRWSAARALGYTQILTDPRRRVLMMSSPGSSLTGDDPTGKQAIDPDDPKLGSEDHPPHSLPCTKVVCIGGGAGAEVIALAAAHRMLETTSTLHITAVDSADWSEPISKLSSALSMTPSLPSHASESFRARPENRPMLHDSSKVGVTFLHQDVLSWPLEFLRDTIQGISLCTVMFTLNELFSSSLPKTTAFLLHITNQMLQGSHLLVVDSPGSYSEISLGKSKGEGSATEDAEKMSVPMKRYPMKWLLDHTLLEVASQGEAAKWDKVESEDSLWFRIEQKDRERLRYAVELENMRYQLHLYRRQ